VTGTTRRSPTPARHDQQSGSEVRATAAGGSDVRRFWAAYSVSALGSGVGAGALPLIAILVLHASDWQVSL